MSHHRTFLADAIFNILNAVAQKKHDPCDHCRQLAFAAQPVAELFLRRLGETDRKDAPVGLNAQEVRNLAFLSVIVSRVPYDIEGKEL